MAKLSLASLKTGTTYNIQVRAVTIAGTSQWSPTFTLTTIADDIPPGTPSVPNVMSYLGQLIITWNGLDALGQPMAKDLDFIQVHRSTTNGFTPIPATAVGSIIGPGSYVDSGLTYGTTYYYKLVAADRSGNVSPVASGQALGIPAKVANVDVGPNAIGTLQVIDGTIVNAKIGNLAVNDAKIANMDGGKINAASIQTDKIAVGVLRTNLPTNASFEDTDIPNSLGIFTTLPGWTLTNNGGTKTAYQETGPSLIIPSVTGRGKVILGCTSGSAGSSVKSDSFPLNPGAQYNWSFWAAGYGHLTARFQSSPDNVTFTDVVGSAVEGQDVIGTESQAFTIHSTVTAVASANGTLATAFANGQVLDGVTLVTGSRILLAGQTNAAENGIYQVTAGTPARASDANDTAEIAAGTAVYVSNGTAFANTFWYCTVTGDVSSDVASVSLTSNIATITTQAVHGLATGQQVLISNVGSPYDGTYIVLSTPTTTTFTYGVVGPNQTTTASSGTVYGAWVSGVGSTWAMSTYIHRPVVAATNVNGTLSSSFQNGSIVDGVTLVTGDRVLIKSQTVVAENGIYVVNSGGAPTRASDANIAGEIKVGDTLHVKGGTINGGGYFQVQSITTDPWVPGTDNAVWTLSTAYVKLNGVYNVPPSGVTFGKIVFTNSNSIGDTLVYLDDVIVMLAGNVGTEITSAGIRLFDTTGSETIRITGAPTGGTFVNITQYDEASNSSKTLASIDDQGGAGFTSVATNALTIGGVDINELFDTGGQVISYGTRTGSCPDQTAEQGFMSVSADLLPGRVYRVFTDQFFLASAGGTFGTGLARLRQETGGVAVGLSSTIISSTRVQATGQAVTTSLSTFIDTGSLLDTTEYQFLVTCLGESGSTSHIIAAVSFPFTLYVQDCGPSDPSIGDVGVDWSVTTTSKKTYVSKWGCRWSSSYFGSNGRNTFWGDDLVQGYYTSANGNQRAMLGFNGNAGAGEITKTIPQALSGATVTKVELYLYNYHWYYNAGGTAVIGYHGVIAAGPPATWSGTPNRLQSHNWPRGWAKWINIPNSAIPFSSWGAGTARGIVLGPGPNTSGTYYGKFYGSSDGTKQPVLRITYIR